MIKCDVVGCVYNKNCNCIASKVNISLTHDNISKVEYIKCDTFIHKKEMGIK